MFTSRMAVVEQPQTRGLGTAVGHAVHNSSSRRGPHPAGREAPRRPVATATGGIPCFASRQPLSHRGSAGMITLFKLLVSPFETWTAIAAENRGILRVWFTYVLPLTLVGCAFEAWAVQHWGTSTGVGGGIKVVPSDLAVRYGVAQFVGLSLAVFVGAFLVQRVDIAFHVNISYTNCVVLVGYALGPVYAARLIDAIPQVPTWLAWAAGILLMLGILYNGLPKALKIEAYGAFGMYLFAVLVLVPVTAVAHGAALYVLTGDVGFGG